MLLVASTREELGDLPGEVCGIGTVIAGVRTARLLLERRPEAVVLVGTGGAYPGGPAVGSAVAARRVGLGHGIAAMGLGYVPRAPQPIACDPGLLGRLGLPEVDVLSVGAVTTDPVLARRLADGWVVEQLEAFGVAAACRELGVPFVAVLGVVGEVGPDAHSRWLTHRGAAQEVAREAVRRLSAGVSA